MCRQSSPLPLALQPVQLTRLCVTPVREPGAARAADAGRIASLGFRSTSCADGGLVLHAGSQAHPLCNADGPHSTHTHREVLQALVLTMAEGAQSEQEHFGTGACLDTCPYILRSSHVCCMYTRCSQYMLQALSSDLAARQWLCTVRDVELQVCVQFEKSTRAHICCVHHTYLYITHTNLWSTYVLLLSDYVYQYMQT